jgi:tripartite-type tricarboxylate transporter receptor subunit TctC
MERVKAQCNSQREDRMRRLPWGLAIAAAIALHGAAVAQTSPAWPTQPITMVVPFAAGGPVDTIGRILAARLGEILGQQVVIENIGGAGGMIGAARVAKATPDGYQFVLATSATHAQNQSLYKSPLYDAATAFAPVALVTDSPRVLITRKDLPGTTLAEFPAYARINQAKMQYGSAGAGAGTHICALLLDQAMGTRITHIPYRGAGPAMQDLIGGRIDYICEQISTAVPQIQAGAVRAIMVLGPDRVPVLPGLVSAREAGLADFDCGAWTALAFPKGTPEAIVRRLARAASEALDTPAVRERLESIGVTVVAPERRSPEYLAKFIVSEIAKWAVPIKASGVEAQ